MKQRLLFLLLCVVIFIRPVLLVVEYKDKFFSTGYSQSYESLRQAYTQSQYAKKKNPIIMPDSKFEQFTAGSYLKGLNPILIVHDHPPLGRYIVALSILMFDNPHTVMLPLLFLITLGVYFLAKIVLRNLFLSLIPVAVFVNEPIFLHKIIETPLLEPIQLPFILFAFYFFLKALEEKKDIMWFVLTSLMVGGIISTRFFILGAAVVGVMGLFLFVSHRLDRKMIRFILTLPVSLLVLLLSYIRTMQDGYSVIQIFSIQKYILAYHQSKFILPFTFWDLLLFNRWHTWWADRAIIRDALWIVLWPIAAICTGGLMLLSLVKKLRGFSNAEKVLMLWVAVQAIMLSTGYTSTRYFLPLLPILYILATSFIFRISTAVVSPYFRVQPHKKARK